ncbi:hypothetical protein [Haloprofundus halobius]|uniref:hypothetical protein n=1 Tax=Haloprofundus halobius TaxID=2876194 RepID=UPI001CCDB348|nr:hypothetical protein [Haloprofundus halobius]
MEFDPNRRQLLRAAAAVPVLGLASQSAGATSERDDYWEFESEFFATAFAEYYGTYDTNSDGDLWPSCWADDGHLYTANGDGTGFADDSWSDIVMNRVYGTPDTGLTGERLAAGDELGIIWADSDEYNRKPTGMVAVDGNGDGNDELYLAYQDLRHSPAEKAFDDAPNASVAKSVDYGETWETTDEPMFSKYVFTTVFFLDYGQSHENVDVLAPNPPGHGDTEPPGTDSSSKESGNRSRGIGATEPPGHGGNNPEEYVYAYGLDNNWRSSFSGTVPDPVRLYLARAPIDSIMDRSTWEFFAGVTNNGRPTWTAELEGREPVLEDERRVYEDQYMENGPNRGESMSVLSQGSVVYNEPLDRYLYTSWTEYTFEFYEAPEPWGPWKLFMRKDFGSLPWFGNVIDELCDGPVNGGYATTIPSKFIGDNGESMWMQANWFEGVACGGNNYNFDLREFDVTPYAESNPSNKRSADNLATRDGTVPIEKSAHYGNGKYYNSGERGQSEDSWDGTAKPLDFWGYLWETEYALNRVVYTTGAMFPDGGWFANDGDSLRVQVRRNFEWVDVDGLSIEPEYPYDETAGPNNTYEFTFEDDHGDGVRIIGVPGGNAAFTSIGELEAYYK